MGKRNRHSLDDQRLCFLSFFFNEQNELDSISFDVEAADDYHYQIYADQLPKLCEFLQCENIESSIVFAFTEQVKKWNNPIKIADMLYRAGVKFKVHHWY